jgi:protein ImuB
MFACLHAPVRPVTRAASTDDDASVGELLRDRLLAAAREFSPRVEVAGLGTVLCDLSGVAKLFGDAPTIAAELRREAADRGIPVRVTVAGTRTAALLVAAARPGVTVIDPGEEAAALEPLPIRTLDALLYLEADRLEVGPKPPGRFYRASPMEEIARHRAASLRRATRSRAHAAVRDVIERHERLMATLERWGIRTLGALASLPAAELSARLGQEGPAWQRIARGDDIGPLVPTEAEERFEGSLALEWPIEGLEPLSFVLGRLLEPIAAHLERRDRAAAALVVELRLVSRETFTRRLQLPSPIRDPRVLRTLALLDLDTNPPPSGIDAVTVRIEPTPGRVLQHSLLDRARPAPEQVSTLMARLTALMGEHRCGSPRVPDTYRPGAFVMQPFVSDRRDAAKMPAATASIPPSDDAPPQPSGLLYAVRRFRQPVPIAVALADDRPVRVSPTRSGIASGRVTTCAGPWRSSGDWWQTSTAHQDKADAVSAGGWTRDEWDVALDDGTVCRIFQDRTTHGWYMEGTID